MRFVKGFLFLSCVAMIANAAHARNIVQPVPVGDETARFDHGRPTITIRRQKGVIQVRPRDLDHGSVAFDIAVFNNSETTANFDTVNVSALANGAALRPFTVTELEKKAKNRAFWTQMAVAALAGTAAGLSASQRDTYTSTLYTPRGVYRGHYSAPSTAGQLAAAGSVIAGGIAISRIEDQLRATLAGMQDNVVQVTTIDPGDSYAGMIVLQKAKKAKGVQRVDVSVSWNNETYPFAFQVVKEGTPTPIFTTLNTAKQSDNPNVKNIPVGVDAPVNAVLPPEPAAMPVVEAPKI